MQPSGGVPLKKLEKVCPKNGLVCVSGISSQWKGPFST
jgi:hypothetical protein